MVALNRLDIAVMSDASDERSPLHGLNEDQQRRLTDQLDRYLAGLESGNPLSPEELKLQNPDLADIFAEYLHKLNALYGAAVGFQSAGGDDAAIDPPSPPPRLGDFAIVREIGRGGMGIVYQAEQRSLGRTVALKLLPLASLLDARQIARFKNEARAAGLLQHPHIVPVYSVGSDRGLHYYAMQFIEGQSMDAWIKAAGPEHESWRIIVQWGMDIATALHAAHETGVVHRDVKPSNLLLDKNGKIWITDFGLARCQTESSLTQSGDVIGTIRYMSPEQARGQSALIDGRSDVYALAASIYEMLTLRSAHEGKDAASIIRIIDEQQVIPLRKMRSDLPRDLETVIAKAMHKNRDGRYETAAALADDLRRVLCGEPTLARPASMADRLGRWASRHRRAVLFTLLVGILGLVGFAVSTATIAAEKQISDAHAARAEKNERHWRGAVDRLGAQMAELLSDIPAADPVRRRLLAETLQYYLQFAEDAEGNPQLREDLAVTYGKIGTLHAELSAYPEAVDALLQSEAIYRELASQSPSDHRLQLDWSTAQNNLGQSLQRAGQLERAARYFSRAIVTQQQLLGTGVGSDAELTLATTLNNLGLLLASSDATAEAEAKYLEAMDLLQTAEALPKSPQAQQQLATVLCNLSGLLSQQAPDRAIAYAQAALSHQTTALEADRGDAKLASQVVVTLNALGSAQSHRHQELAAVATFTRAVELGQQLLARWPDRPTYQRDLVVSLNHLGLAHAKAGELSPACQAFEQALSHGRTLVESFPGDAETQSMLGGVLNNLGFLQQQLHQTQAAAESYRQAIEAQSTAVGLSPDVQRFRSYLQKHQQNYRSVTEQDLAS